MTPTNVRTDFAYRLRHNSIAWVSFVIGIGYFVAGLAGGQPGFGIFGLVLMGAIGLATILFRGRSETMDALITRGDERINSLDLRATAMAGFILICTVVISFMIAIARGDSGAPFDWLAAIGGVSYLVALVYLRFRG